MMNNEQKKDLLLYIHIPFCKKKCSYCDFLSGPGTGEEIKNYINHLLLEIKAYEKEAADLKDYIVTSIFFGGGTPSFIEPSFIAKIIEQLERVFSFAPMPKMEITLEANPGTLEKHSLKIYKDAGVNRLSLGLQSALDKELELLGRIHTYSQFLESYNMARKAGFENINIDLMNALPGQTEQSFEQSLKTIISLEPEHISAYSLMIEEGTPFYDLNEKGLLTLPSEESERAMYYMAGEILQYAGYQRYEISNYAKKGFECRHNTGYWSRTSYLGLGLGAASLFKETRFTNISDRRSYEEAKGDLKKIHPLKESLAKREQIEEYMFLGLRKTEGISIEAFKKCFNIKPEKIYGAVLAQLTKENLIQENGGFICLTDYGIDVSNYVLSQFLQPKVI